jgi:hypothetical protein
MVTLTQYNDGGKVSSDYKVDISRGRNVSRVSSEWYSRPDDEKFLSLNDLYDSVRGRAEHATRDGFSWQDPSGTARSSSP